MSVVIPVFNEEGNIVPLAERMHRAFVQRGLVYELVFIDDHSTDDTRGRVRTLMRQNRVRLYLKKGVKGKAQSIMEGVSYARHPIVAMIDGDLQYPPEAIPGMARDVAGRRADIMVANRAEHNEGLFRKFISRSYSLIFNKYILKLDYDVQSGLKVFRKEIMDFIDLHPTPWTFDMEFLTKARYIGYRIGSRDIVFEKRTSGKSKVGVLRSSLEIGLSAIKLRLTEPEVGKSLPEIGRQRLGLDVYKLS